MVVLWSKQSVESPWVRDEAAAGRDKGRLVPASIDGTPPAPLSFRQYQASIFPAAEAVIARPLSKTCAERSTPLRPQLLFLHWQML